MELRNIDETKKLFPHWLDKNDESNFSKHLTVINNQQLDILHKLKCIEWSRILEKPIQIKKKQTVPYEYSMEFRCDIPNLKQINIYKNPIIRKNEVIGGELIESVDFEDIEQHFYKIIKDFTFENGGIQRIYEDQYVLVEKDGITYQVYIDKETGEDTFDEYLKINDVEVLDDEGNKIKNEPKIIKDVDITPIIPNDTFVVEVYTYDDYHWLKGYPQNDYYDESYETSYFYNRRVRIYLENISGIDYLTFRVHQDSIKMIEVLKNNHLIHIEDFIIEKHGFPNQFINDQFAHIYNYNDNTVYYPTLKKDTDSLYRPLMEKNEYVYRLRLTDDDFTIDELSNQRILKDIYDLKVTYFNVSTPNDRSKDETIVKRYSGDTEYDTDVFEHDESLDIIGNILNIHRFKFIKVHEETIDYYSRTYPTFYNRLIEDDYSYQQRIKFYINNYNKMYFPCLEFWKYYHTDSRLVNRKVMIAEQCNSYIDNCRTGRNKKITEYKKNKADLSFRDRWENISEKHKVKIGYYHQDNFYIDLEYSKSLILEENVEYVDIITNNVYSYDGTTETLTRIRETFTLNVKENRFYKGQYVRFYDGDDNLLGRLELDDDGKASLDYSFENPQTFYWYSVYDTVEKESFYITQTKFDAYNNVVVDDNGEAEKETVKVFLEWYHSMIKEIYSDDTDEVLLSWYENKLANKLYVVPNTKYRIRFAIKSNIQTFTDTKTIYFKDGNMYYDLQYTQQLSDEDKMKDTDYVDTATGINYRYDIITDTFKEFDNTINIRYNYYDQYDYSKESIVNEIHYGDYEEGVYENNELNFIKYNEEPYNRDCDYVYMEFITPSDAIKLDILLEANDYFEFADLSIQRVVNVDFDTMYMRAELDYNSCVYDLYANYNDIPTNIYYKNINNFDKVLNRSLPLSKKGFFNFELTDFATDTINIETSQNIVVNLVDIDNIYQDNATSHEFMFSKYIIKDSDYLFSFDCDANTDYNIRCKINNSEFITMPYVDMNFGDVDGINVVKRRYSLYISENGEYDITLEDDNLVITVEDENNNEFYCDNTTFERVKSLTDEELYK